jgi:hypothetical protein
MPTIQDSRILIKSSTVTGVIPTVPASNDHTDGTWLVTDLYKGELFVNQADNKVFTRTASGIIQIYPTATMEASSFILISPDTHRWRVTIDNSGALQFEDLGT